MKKAMTGVRPLTCDLTCVASLQALPLPFRTQDSFTPAIFLVFNKYYFHSAGFQEELGPEARPRDEIQH